MLFPWDHSGLNYAAIHPDLVDAAERIIETREIRLCESHLGMKYAGEEHWATFHIDYGNNRLGPLIEKDDFMNLSCFYCFDEVEEGMAPIRMVPNGQPGEEAVPMVVLAGSLCLYSVFTRHAASEFVAPRGHRPVMWVGFTRRAIRCGASLLSRVWRRVIRVLIPRHILPLYINKLGVYHEV
ncbi:MAG: hypothetical protein ACKVJG_09790 [Candidatus Latescibacterota bacterium]